MQYPDDVPNLNLLGLFKVMETLAKEARSRMNISMTTCQCCGLKKQTNWTEANAAKELDGIIRKIRKYERLLENDKWNDDKGTWNR